MTDTTKDAGSTRHEVSAQRAVEAMEKIKEILEYNSPDNYKIKYIREVFEATK